MGTLERERERGALAIRRERALERERWDIKLRHYNERHDCVLVVIYEIILQHLLIQP